MVLGPACHSVADDVAIFEGLGQRAIGQCEGVIVLDIQAASLLIDGYQVALDASVGTLGEVKQCLYIVHLGQFNLTAIGGLNLGGKQLIVNVVAVLVRTHNTIHIILLGQIARVGLSHVVVVKNGSTILVGNGALANGCILHNHIVAKVLVLEEVGFHHLGGHSCR